MAAPMDFWPGGAEEDDDDFDEDGFFIGDHDSLGSKAFDPIQQNSSAETQGSRGGFDVSKPKSRPTVPFKKMIRADKVVGRNASRVLSLGDFQMAILRGQKTTVEEYLKQGCNVDDVLKSGWTGLMYAASVANSNIVKLLLDKGGNPNFHKDMYTVLMAACGASGYKEEEVLHCVDLLLGQGSEVNSYDRFHMTPLMYAAREGHPLVVNRLVTAGANVNKQDSRGWTAVTWAVSKNHRFAVKALLDVKADPKMKHCDGQTAVDLAYTAENDEMVAMLEGRKLQQNGYHGNSLAPVTEGTSPAVQATGSSSLLSSATDSSTSDGYGTRYGELELFLCGLDLGSLVPLFKEQHVDFSTFLRLTDSDFMKMGISQIGIRRKILDGIHMVHKKEWDKTSLPSSLNKKQISCAEAIAIVANISKHERYIGSTLGFIQDQIRLKPTMIEELSDGTGPKQLHQHAIDAINNVQQVSKELDTLRISLEKVLKSGNFDPPDVIPQHKDPPQHGRLHIFSLVSFGFILVGLFVKRKSISDSIITMLYSQPA